MIRLGERVGDTAPTIGCGQVQAVSDRTVPVRPGLKASQAFLDTQHAPHVTRVAIGIPAAGIDDHQRFLKVVVTVQERMDDQGVIGHHVAIAAELVVAVGIDDMRTRGPPILWVLGVPLSDIVDQSVDDRVLRDEAHRRIDERVDITLHEGLGLHGCDDLRAVDCLAVMADAGRTPR